MNQTCWPYEKKKKSWGVKKKVCFLFLVFFFLLMDQEGKKMVERGKRRIGRNFMVSTWHLARGESSLVESLSRK